MAYDFSVTSRARSRRLDWVESAIVGVLEATEHPEKIVLGVPAYGRNWPTSVAGSARPRTCPGGRA